MSAEDSSESLPKKPQGKLEARAPEVIAMLLTGGTERAVAEAFGASPRGVVKFKQRHEPELRQVKADLVEAVKDSWLSDNVERIEKLQWLYEQAEAEAKEFGVTVVEKRTEIDGDKETVIETRDFRASMYREMRGIITDAATLLGQMPKSGVTINDNRTQVLIREYRGFNPDAIR